MNSAVNFWPIRTKQLDVERDKRVTIVRKVKSNFPACKSWLNSHVRGQFEIKSLIVRLINTTSYFLCVKKIELEPTIIWKVITCQRITSKTRTQWADSWAHDTVRWWWSTDAVVLTAVNWLNCIRMANFRINGLLTASVSKTFQSGL